MDRVRALIARFDGSGFRSREARAAAIEELQQLGAEGQRYLLQLFADPDSATRANAATAMVMTYGPVGQAFILPLLRDADDSVRWHTCGLLYDFGDADAVPSLVERLRTDTDVSVRV